MGQLGIHRHDADQVQLPAHHLRDGLRAAWTTDPIYTLPSDDTNEFSEPFSFAVNTWAGVVGVAMLYGPETMPGVLYPSGEVREYSTSSGALVKTLNPPLPGAYVVEGDLDGQNDIVAKGGRFWIEDDWYSASSASVPSRGQTPGS